MQVEPHFDEEDELAADDDGRSSQTKQKCFVAVLLVVLLIAVLCQPNDEQPSDQSAPMISLKADRAVDATAGTQATTSDMSRFGSTRQLSRTSLDEVVNSPVFRAERIQSPQKEPPRVQPSQLTVQAVYGSGSQQSAIMGNAIVRSGQPLPDGRKVLSVTPDGVKLGQ